MPRPTPSQLAYGTTTVVASTLALLLLFQARSALAVSLVSMVALVLGTVVALATGPARRPAAGAEALPTLPVQAPGGGSQTPVGEHPLYR